MYNCQIVIWRLIQYCDGIFTLIGLWWVGKARLRGHEVGGGAQIKHSAQKKTEKKKTFFLMS